MVEVRVHVDRVVLLEHSAELGRDALGHHHGSAGAETDDLHVGDGPQALEDRFQVVVGQHEGIAAADEDIPHLGMGGNVVDGLLDVLLGHVDIGVAHEAAPRAVAAVHAADVGDQQQHPVRVAVGEARHRAVHILVEGIRQIGGIIVQFRQAGHGLHAHGAVGILPIHQRRVVGRDLHGELGEAPLQVLALLLREREDLLQGGDVPDGVLELPPVVVPFGFGHILEEGDAAPVNGVVVHRVPHWALRSLSMARTSSGRASSRPQSRAMRAARSTSSALLFASRPLL